MKKLKFSPVQIIALGFLGVILLGTLLLMLPLSSRTQEWTNFLDALFVSTSATCVTGLTTLPTNEHWAPFGQFVLAILMETGGLGFITMFVFAFFLSNRKVSLSTRLIAKEAYNMVDMKKIVKTTLHILQLSVLIQVVGAILLAFPFSEKLGVAKGIWYGVFHSISAFCNAGFDLFGDSLIQFQHNPFVLLVISFLIISGGLGFVVWADLLDFKIHKGITIHTRLALRVTFILLLGGFFLFLLSERHHSFPNFVDQLLNCFFLSTTARTAGFASVDYTHLSYAGLILTIWLMFIGGTSGSTAGGIKTTTIGVLVLKVWGLLRGKERTTFHERTIPETVVQRAFLAFFLMITLTVLSTFLLLLTESVPLTSGVEYVVFEVVSALATVGLSVGLTPELTMFGKTLLILLMFIGRIGIFTLIFSISKPHKKESYKYPEESVIIT